MTRVEMNRRQLVKGLLATGAVALAGTGCGGESAGATAVGKLSVGQVSQSIAFFPLFVATKKGYFKDEGVAFDDPPVLGNGSKVAAALKSGSIQVGGGVMTDVFKLSEIEDDIRLVADLVDKYYIDIITGKKFKGAAVSASLDERTKSLKGRKIGITGPGSGTEALVIYLFAKAGLDAKKDAELVNLGSEPTAALGALKNGQVDALSFAQPLAQQAEAAGTGTLYISPCRGDIPGLVDVSHGVFFTTQSVQKKKAKEIAAFQRALVRAKKDIRGNDTAEVKKLLAEYRSGMPDATLEALLPLLKSEIPATNAFKRSSFDAAVTFHKSAGLITKTPDYDRLVPSNLRET
ncbi:ABC transporter substrate-binding protein [Streptomyces cylindrosporus]|uniref:ABC transporter substrate-binding protein n=1 Tax=Streptomyces cylindrosporus TaxID=2927583 RepID=A0ABS9YFH6_9ACTN|nr:ABC transporter substrate-binding protein [Streptomyces cylindrosporus]MCI3275305.1 ABC transporter substrate-binding protein [Streptomyces cylindrosporus]